MGDISQKQGKSKEGAIIESLRAGDIKDQITLFETDINLYVPL